MGEGEGRDFSPTNHQIPSSNFQLLNIDMFILKQTLEDKGWILHISKTNVGDPGIPLHFTPLRSTWIHPSKPHAWPGTTISNAIAAGETAGPSTISVIKSSEILSSP